MSEDQDGLSDSQRRLIEEFLDLFGEIERSLKLKMRLRTSDRTSVTALSARYRESNPFWAESDVLLAQMAGIRNLLVHGRNSKHGYPVAVTRQSVKSLAEINRQLVQPVTVSEHFRRKVDTVTETDPLSLVVAHAFDKGYSQFPVTAEGRFVGLITENEITRWLGRRAKTNGSQIDLTAVPVKTVLREKDPFREGIPIFQFVRLSTPVNEVMGLFSIRPALEAVLLTATGSGRVPLEGIITQWDAARYSP